MREIVLFFMPGSFSTKNMIGDEQWAVGNCKLPTANCQLYLSLCFLCSGQYWHRTPGPYF